MPTAGTAAGPAAAHVEPDGQAGAAEGAAGVPGCGKAGDGGAARGTAHGRQRGRRPAAADDVPDALVRDAEPPADLRQ
jgi:hypothetical protein